MPTVRTLTGDVRVVLNPVEIEALINSPGGPIVRDLFVRGERVKIRAIHEAPKRTRNLANHIVKRLVRGPGGQPQMLVGVEHVPYALFVHEGTRPHTIEARNASFLVFVGRDGNLVFTKRVNHPGNKPNRFLIRALPAAAG